MVDVKVKIEGLRELEKALAELPKATGKNVLRRVLRKRAQPIAEDYRSRVRVDQGDLKDGIGVSTKLTTNQRRLHRSSQRQAGGKTTVEMFVGAPPLPQSVTEEFGTDNQAPHPGLRPAWAAGKGRLLDGIADDLSDEISKAAARQARRAAKRKG